MGLGVVYRPWNLSATYVPPIGDQTLKNLSTYSLSYTRSFGGTSDSAKSSK